MLSMMSSVPSTVFTYLPHWHSVATLTFRGIPESPFWIDISLQYTGGGPWYQLSAHWSIPGGHEHIWRRSLT